MCAFMRVKGCNIYNTTKVINLSFTLFTAIYLSAFQRVKCQPNLSTRGVNAFFVYTPKFLRFLLTPRVNNFFRLQIIDFGLSVYLLDALKASLDPIQFFDVARRAHALPPRQTA